MNTHEVLQLASVDLQRLTGHVFDVLTISRPRTVGQAANLTKVISKLSPFIGSLIAFNTVDFLNAQPVYQPLGELSILASYVYCTQISETTGKRRMLRELTLPAMCPLPLFQMLAFT